MKKGEAAVVVFQPEGRRISWDLRKNLLEAAGECGVEIESLCGGRGSCSKCRVYVRRGSEYLSPPTDMERRRLMRGELETGLRLSCQCAPLSYGEVVLEVAQEARRALQRLQTSGYQIPFERDPIVRRHTFAVRFASEEKDARASILEGLGAELNRPFRLACEIPNFVSMARDRAVELGAVLREDEVLHLGTAEEATPLHGMAFDIGTTKLAGFLLDLETGDVVSTASRPNPQISYGEDVMSRLALAISQPSAENAMHEVLIRALSEMIDEACAASNVGRESIFDLTAVGNTMMHHLLLGLPVGSLASAPYLPATDETMNVRCGEIGLDANPSAYLTAPPVLGGFVGSDCLAGVIATGLDEADELSVLADVGTNTEIVAGTRERLVACSSPSGPAFEGDRIKFGMRASDGAIERVAIDPEQWRVDYRTVGGAKPRGICGSAMIDLLAELFKNRLVDRTGKLNTDPSNPRVRIGPEGPEFLVAKGQEAAGGNDIVLNQNDIVQIQLAKAAIFSGITTLLDVLEKKTDEISRLYIAGAFGNYIAPESARMIGLFPDIDLDRMIFVGNTAGSGARMALLSRQKRRRMEDLSQTIGHIQLPQRDAFSKEFARALLLPNADLSLFPRIAAFMSGESPKPREEHRSGKQDKG